MVDLWFLGLCVAVKKGIEPADIKKCGKDETYKIIDGSIFTNDPWRIQAMMLLAIAKFGDIEIVDQPGRMMSLVNGYAIAGLPFVVEMLKEGEDDAIWNLSEELESLIP
jgi:hypothetical protein